MTDKIKNLTLTELKKQSKKLDKTESFAIKIGGDSYNIDYDVVFRKTKQHKVIDDILTFFRQGNENAELLNLATAYTALLIVKHFTSLYVPDDIDEALAIMHILIDLEVLDVIVGRLPEFEVAKIHESLQKTIDTMNANVDVAELEALEISKELKNDEVKEMINSDNVR